MFHRDRRQLEGRGKCLGGDNLEFGRQDHIKCCTMDEQYIF